MDPLNGADAPPAVDAPNEWPATPRSALPPPVEPGLKAEQVWLAVRDSARVVLTALLLAFVFRAFFVEPFIIPTGSMAPGLLGQHWVGLCPRCGCELLVNAGEDVNEPPPAQVPCGNCRAWIPTPGIVQRGAGDRILVHKWPLDLRPPQRWEVIVFRDPLDPQTNYIKRVVALPNEEVEIRNGDIYIDGLISRKPAAVQEGLWIPVFDQRYAPVAEEDRVVRWAAGGSGAAGWTGLDERVLRFAPTAEGPGRLYFGAQSGEYGSDFFAYNSRSTGAPIRDIRVRADVQWLDAVGQFEATLTFYPWSVSISIGRDGSAELTYVSFAGGALPESRTEPLRWTPRLDVSAVEVSHVDQRVRVVVDGKLLWSADLDEPEQAAARAYAMGRESAAASIELGGARGALNVRNFRVDRDVHYTESRRSRRALAGAPFALESGEYFVLGDNSPDSHDAREWESAGLHMGADYRIGTVPSRQIVGRAALVYLPGLRARQVWGVWPAIDLARVRFVR